MKALRIILIMATISVAPIVRNLCYFQAGRDGEPCDLNMVGNDLSLLLIAPFVVGIATFVVVPAKGTLRRLAFGFAAFFVTPILVFLAPPAPVISYSHGFEHAIENDIGVSRLQQWTAETLVKFHQGTLSTTNAASYWSAGEAVLMRRDLPPFLTTGIFAPGGDPNYGPEISIRTNDHRAGECIAFCWYDHGLVVGSAQFMSDWRTQYFKQLRPGVYSYYMGK